DVPHHLVAERAGDTITICRCARPCHDARRWRSPAGRTATSFLARNHSRRIVHVHQGVRALDLECKLEPGLGEVEKRLLEPGRSRLLGERGTPPSRLATLLGLTRHLNCPAPLGVRVSLAESSSVWNPTQDLLDGLERRQARYAWPMRWTIRSRCLR